MNPAQGLLAKIGVLLALVVVIGVPFIFRPAEAREPPGGKRLVIITPHNEQIRYEFGRAFDAWHRRNYNGEPAVIDWRQPGGTSEIRKLIVAQYTEALRTGRITPEGELRPGAQPMPFDVFIGGGTFEHGQMKTGIRLKPVGSDKEVTLPLSVPMGFSQKQLDDWFGPNTIGSGFLYDPGDPAKGDPGQHWLGTALSGFGIVFNRDAMRSLGLPDPTSWRDLADPRLIGWVALADARQSGSVATTYDSILNNYGWDEGWKILRGLSANARYFSNASTKPPIDVSQGEAAAGVAIDFYGRYQAQAVMGPGETPATSRVGYIDPPGVTYIDADPVTIMRGGPNLALARCFVEFMLTEEAQALWQLPAREKAGARAGAGAGARASGAASPDDGLGPQRFELRRMPVRRVMYEMYADRMIDKIDPFASASKVAERGWRSAIGPMMGAFSVDIHAEQAAAWRALNAAKAGGRWSAAMIEGLESEFYAMPMHVPPDGRQLLFAPENFKEIRNDWREAEKTGRMTEIRLEYTRFFRDKYRGITESVAGGPPGRVE